MCIRDRDNGVPVPLQGHELVGQHRDAVGGEDFLQRRHSAHGPLVVAGDVVGGGRLSLIHIFITADYLREQNGTIRSADFVLFYTGWERKWGTGAYYDDDFPVPDQEAAKYLVSCGLKGVGTDALSVDPCLLYTSQKAMAELLGKTERHYQAIEAGCINVPATQLIFLAGYFQTSVDRCV